MTGTRRVVNIDVWCGLDSGWLAPAQVAATGLVAVTLRRVPTGAQR